MIEKDIRESED